MLRSGQMRKQVRRHGKLLQQSKKRIISVNDIQQHQVTEGMFRVIVVRIDQTKAWIYGDYSTFKAAKAVVDMASPHGVNYYIHASSSRILYSKKGVVDA